MGRAEINAIVRQQLLKMTEYYIGFEAPGSSSPSTHIYRCKFKDNIRV